MRRLWARTHRFLNRNVDTSCFTASTAMIEFYDLRCCVGAGKAKTNRGHLSGPESRDKRAK